MEHEPGGLLSHADAAGNLVGGDAVLQFTTSQIVGIHLSSPMRESSKIVPTLTLNCRWQSFQRHRRRLAMYAISLPPQVGHEGPLGHRIFATNSVAWSRSEK